MEKILRQYGKCLRKCALFADFSDEEMLYALQAFSAVRMLYAKGALMHPAGEPLFRFGLVLAGTVQVCCDDLDGNRMLMANVTPGGTFGESLAFLRLPEPNIAIYATENAEVLWLSTTILTESPQTPSDFRLQQRFSAMLAMRTLKMNDRIQILSKLTLQEKILTYLNELTHQSGSDSVSVPMNREALASYIGTNRSALSRALSQLQQAGILTYEKNVFHIKRRK